MRRLPVIEQILKVNKLALGLRKLTDKQKIIFEDFKFLLDCSNASGRARILFRGGNLKHLEAKLYRVGSCNGNISDLYKRCFFVGDKSNNYLLDGSPADSFKRWPFDIENFNEGDIDFIFKEMKQLEGHSTGMFNLIESDLVEYFVNVENFKDFKHKFNSVDTSKEKLLLRDYYVWLLHNLGKKTFSESSYYISATSIISEAERYARYEGDDKSPVIIVYFVPNPTEHFGYNFDEIMTASPIVNGLGLPNYNMPAWDEGETLLKGALFPHYVFGIYDMTTKNFILNKHFFEQKNFSISKIITKGLTINQNGFNDFLGSTGYGGGVATNSEGLHRNI